RMKGSDGPSLDCSNKNSVGVRLMILDKISRSLLRGNCNKRNPLVGRLEPHNLGLLLLPLLRTRRSAFPGLPFSLLLLFGGLAAWTQKPKSSTKISISR